MANELSIKVMGDASDASSAFNSLRGDADKSLGGVETASAGLKSAIESDSGQAGQALGDLGSDFKDLERDAGSAVDGIKSKMGGLDFGALGGAVGGAAMFGAFESATTSAGTLQAQLGLTAEEAREFDSVAKQVYGNNFGESMGDASQTVGMVHQALGLTGDALRDATEDVYRVSDAFGHLGADPAIITENVRTMKAAFPGKSEAEILDIIASGFQNGAGMSGDFQDTLQEYPRFFSEIGLSAEDMNNFLITGMKNGARNSDLLGDAVKEMGIIVREEGSNGQKALAEMFGDEQAGELIRNFGEGGEAGRDAFFKILEGLDQIEDPLERNQRYVELFGTKGEDLAGVMGDMIPQFLATKDATNQVGDATSLLDAQYAGTASMLEGFKRRMETSLIGPLGSVAGPALEAGTAVSGLGATLLGMQGMGVNIAGGFSKMASTMMTVLNPMRLMTVAQAGLNLVMSANPIALIVLAIAGLAAGLIIAYRESETFRNIVNSAFGAVRDAVMSVVGFLTSNVLPFFTTTLPGAFSGLRDTVSGVFNGLLSTVQTVFTGIQTFIQPAIDLIRLVITNWANNLKIVWDTLWPPFLTAVQLVWDGIKLYIETYILAIKTVIETTLAAVKAVWDTLWPPFQAIVETVWGAIKSVVESQIEAVRLAIDTGVNAVRSIWETVWGTLQPVLEPILSAVRSLVETTLGAIQGVVETVLGAIQSAWETIWGAVRSVAETIWDAIKSVIETQLGLIVDFVTGDLSGLRDTMAGIWDAVSGKASDIWNTIKDTVTDLVTGTKDNVVNAITETRDTLSNLWDDVKSKTDDIWTGIRDRVSQLGTEVKDRVTGAITGLRDTLSSLWNEVKGTAERLWRELRDGISGLASEARDDVSGIIGEIPGKIEDGLSGLWQIGRDAIQSLWDGMTSIASDVLSWASTFASDIVGKLGDVPRFSPIEHATAWVGKRAMQGLEDGIERNASGVLGSAQHVSQDTVAMFQQVAQAFLAAEGGMAANRTGLISAHAAYTGRGSAAVPFSGTSGPSEETTELIFNGPVTINARDRDDAERSMNDAAWGLRAARRRRGGG